MSSDASSETQPRLLPMQKPPTQRRPPAQTKRKLSRARRCAFQGLVHSLCRKRHASDAESESRAAGGPSTEASK
jgi:hypothetical protein